MLKQSLQQKQLQKLSPLQIQTIRLLELPLVQMEERIKKELEENPVLEEGDSGFEEHESVETEANGDEFTLEDYIDDDETPTYKLSANNISKEENKEYSTMANQVTLHQTLEEQLALQYLDNREHTLGLFIIGSIDNDGYLRRSLESIIDDIAFKMGIETTTKDLERVLKVIKTFDPSGVGARTLQECLLIQLQNKKPSKAVKLARFVIADYFDEFSKKHFGRISTRLNLDDATLKEVLYEILKLNPKPGSMYENMYTEQAQKIIPDFILELKNGEPELSLNAYEMPELRINRDYAEMIGNFNVKSNPTSEERDTINFIKQKIESAKWFIDAIKQRNKTMLDTMEAIMKFQREYFKTGNENNLKPMVLRDIAELIRLDISTVSRVVNSKYIQCDWGVFSLRYFFSEGIRTDDGEVSSREVRNIIAEHVEMEDKYKPLTDEELKDILKEKGFVIARRTVAKYREKMNIPVARLRREI